MPKNNNCRPSLRAAATCGGTETGRLGSEFRSTCDVRAAGTPATATSLQSDSAGEESATLIDRDSEGDVKRISCRSAAAAALLSCARDCGGSSVDFGAMSDDGRTGKQDGIPDGELICPGRISSSSISRGFASADVLDMSPVLHFHVQDLSCAVVLQISSSVLILCSSWHDIKIFL